jgi:hypothetical protein
LDVESVLFKGVGLNVAVLAATGAAFLIDTFSQ